MRILFLIFLFFSFVISKEYSIIAFSTKKFNLKAAQKFIKRFPNGVVKQYSRFVEYKIEPFKDYKSAKEFLKKVKKYYKYPLIVPYNPKLGKVLYPKVVDKEKKDINKKETKITINKNKVKKIYEKQKLIYCKTKCGCKVPKKYVWEINKNEILNNIDIKIENYLKEYNQTQRSNIASLNNEIKKENKCIAPFEQNLMFYIDIYANKFEGQKNNFTLYGDSENLKLGLIYERYFNDYWKFYTDDRVIFSRDSFRGKSNTDIYLDINELYFRSYCLNDDLTNILIGRKKTKDYRSWIYDMPLDQIRVFNSNKKYLLNYIFLAATRINDEKVTDNNSKIALKDSKFLILNLDYEYYYKQHVGLIYMFEKIKPKDELNLRRFHYLGLDLHGKKEKLKYWANLLLSEGTMDFYTYTKEDKGIAFDVGVKYQIDYNLAFAASIASGSEYFHQPYISTNYSDYLKKGFNYKYYGFVLNPSLDNLQILSIYGIYDLNDYSTFILSLHSYRQTKAMIQNYNGDYVFNTNGENRYIGSEIDAVYQYLKTKYQKFKIGFGYFLGGSAYDVDKKSAFRAFLNYRLYFR